MNSSTACLATESGTWIGGCLKAYEDMLSRAPPILRSSAILTARIKSITTPALLGESSTSSFAVMVNGLSPNFLPLSHR